MQEFVEKENIACLIGPLATAEALAIDDYIRDKQIPTLSVAAAEDMTQRKANPWFVRATSSSAQCSYPMGDYAAKELKYKRAAMIADDIAYGHELNAGFQRAFEDAGGKVVQKLWSPLVTPDYGTYIGQLKDNVDVIFIGFAGSNGFKFFKQYKEYGKTKPLLGGQTAVDEALLQQMGDEAIGLVSTCWYSAQIDTPTNKKFVDGMNRDYKVDPGFYAAATYTNAAVLEVGAQEDQRQDRGQERADGGTARKRQGRDRARPGELRQIRQRGRQRLYPQGREEGRQAGQHRHQDLSQRQPVLDLQSGRIPEASGVQSRELAGWQKSRAVTRARSPRATRAGILAQPQKSITMPSRGRKTMTVNRRSVIKGALAAGVATQVLKVPAAPAQAGPIRVGFLTIKTGPLASGGLQMEQGLTVFFKERNNMLAGRPVELHTADTAGNPAQARTKTQELVERLNVAVLIGPLAAFEALAIDDYIRSSRTPILSVAGAEDMTQRKPNPWFVRPSCTSAQTSHPLGDYAAKELKYKRVATIGDDFAFGHECVAGFQRAFEDAGGKVVQKLWTPLNAPDYGTYISQLKPNLDAVFTAHAGSNGFKFIRQLREYGNKIQILGGFTPVDESLLQQMGDDALGAITGNWYSAELDFPINKRFVEAIRRDYKVDPGVYAAETYLCGEVLDHAVKSDQRQGRGQGCLHEGAARRESAEHPARSGAVRRVRQCGRQRLHPQGREEGRQIRQRGDQDLSRRQPVLDLQAGRVPEESRSIRATIRRRRIWSSDRTLPLRRGGAIGFRSRERALSRPGEGSAPSSPHMLDPTSIGRGKANYRCSGSSGSSRR